MYRTNIHLIPETSTFTPPAKRDGESNTYLYLKYILYLSRRSDLMVTRARSGIAHLAQATVCFHVDPTNCKDRTTICVLSLSWLVCH